MSWVQPKISLQVNDRLTETLNNDKLSKRDYKIIPTFQIPYVHRDMWNDKDFYYSIEGKGSQS